MGIITGLKLTYLSSAEKAAELISKMEIGNALSSLASLKGERLVRVLASLGKEKRQELMHCMGPATARRLFESLSTGHVIYVLNSVPIRTRRVVAQNFSVKTALRIIAESGSQSASFLFLFDKSKITEILEEFDKRKQLAGFINSFDKNDKIELASNLEPKLIPGVVEKWNKEDVLEVAERVPQAELKVFLDAILESQRRFVLRKLSIDKLMSVVSNLNNKEHVSAILKSAGVGVFSRILERLPQKQVTTIFSFFSDDEKAGLFEQFDLSKLVDIISSWPITKQAECVGIMGSERASLLIDEVPMGSQVEILKMLPPVKAAAMLKLVNVGKQSETIKRLPFESMVRIFELMPMPAQKEIMECWDFGAKQRVFNSMDPQYASRMLRSLHTGGRLKVLEGVSAAQCANIMSGWEVELILADFREAAFTKHVVDIIRLMRKDLRNSVCGSMDLILKNRLGL